MKRNRLIFGGVGAAVAAIAVVAIVASGGGSSTKSSSAYGSPVSHKSSPAPSTAPATTIPAPAPAPAPAAVPAAASVKVAHDAKLGDILVAGSGRTVYTFAKDQGTVSACAGQCAMTWPVWMTNGAPQGGPGVNASLLGYAHGQVTYAGHLLYFFSGDPAAGATNGVGIPSWYAISPTGTQVGH